MAKKLFEDRVRVSTYVGAVEHKQIQNRAAALNMPTAEYMRGLMTTDLALGSMTAALDSEMIEKIEKAAKSEGVTLAAFFKRTLVQAIARQENNI